MTEPVSGDSERVTAFRGRMAGLVQANTANRDATAQRWKETVANADRKADERIAQAQKLVQRVRERAQTLRKQHEELGRHEISVGTDSEVEDVDPEVERFAHAMLEGGRASVEAAPTAPQTGGNSAPASTLGSESVTAPWNQAGANRLAGAANQDAASHWAGWPVRAGRFGRPQHPETPSAPERQAPPAGQRSEQPVEPSASPEQHKPKPAPRRRPAFDDEDEDFSNQTWLR